MTNNRTIRLLLSVLDLGATFIAPFVVLYLQYYKSAEFSSGLKIGFTAVLITAVVVFAVLRLFRKWIDRKQGELVNYTTDFKTEGNEDRKKLIKAEKAKVELIISFYNKVQMCTPIAILFIFAKWAEISAMKLSTTAGYILFCWIGAAVIKGLRQLLIAKNKI